MQGPPQRGFPVATLCSPQPASAFLHVAGLSTRVHWAQRTAHAEILQPRAACAGVGIDWLIDMRLARAPLLWAGMLCFSAATFLGTLAHVARLKGLKAQR